MYTCFISDLHLEDSRPETAGLLLDFVAGPARQADALYILGDLFEFWIGDDVPNETALKVAAGLSDLAASGVDIFFMHGNRDFLIGEHYARLAGMTLLPEEIVIDLHGTPTLLLHGDSLCTDDAAYQAFRRQVRDPRFQADFLGRSIPERLAIARQARDASRAHTGQASMDIMDVNQDSVKDAFARNRVCHMIHGHTHRPAVHQHRLPANVGRGERTAQRIVLADWYKTGSYLRVEPGGFESVPLPGT